MNPEKVAQYELHDLYYTPNIFRIIKLRETRLEEHVVRRGEKRNAYTFFV
jgi:hypothetical protein